MNNKSVFTLRIDEKVLNKIKKIANTNKRSTAMQIEYSLEVFIKDYEKVNGEIN